MKKTGSIGALLSLAVCMAATCAFAAPDGFISGMMGASGKRAIEPSDQPPPLPPKAQPPAKVSLIPALPASTPCKKEDIDGLWRLQHIYEEPVGSETANYATNPVQYILFNPNGGYGRLNAANAEPNIYVILDQIKAHATGLLQYVVQGSGLIYFYHDKVATETLSCFIVATASDQFPAGNMLLMPPKGQIKGRLIKEYKRLWSRPLPPKQKPRPRINLAPAPAAR